MSKIPKMLDFNKTEDKGTFFLPLFGKNKNGAFEVNANLRMQVDILPIKQASETPVGQARDEANHSPFLPPPVGRISLSLNPFKMYK